MRKMWHKYEWVICVMWHIYLSLMWVTQSVCACVTRMTHTTHFYVNVWHIWHIWLTLMWVCDKCDTHNALLRECMTHMTQTTHSYVSDKIFYGALLIAPYIGPYIGQSIYICIYRYRYVYTYININIYTYITTMHLISGGNTTIVGGSING